MDTKQLTKPNVIVGISLILLGLLFFAVTQGAFQLNWENIWPAFMIFAGLLLIVYAFSMDQPGRRAGLVIAGTIALLVGSFFMTTTLGLISWNDQGVLWPVYPLIVGVGFLAGYFASGRETTGYLMPGAGLIVIGLVFLTINLVSFNYGDIGRLWPLFLIVAGLFLLVQRRRS
jgi:hypothetical protein